MDVGTINSMFHHLPNLSVDLFGVQFSVPEPERADAVSATRLLESRMKRREGTGRQRPGRQMCRTGKVDPTNAGAGYPEKFPPCDPGHGRRLDAPLRGLLNECKASAGGI